MKTPKQTKKYKEDIKNFGEPERASDVYKYLGSLIIIVGLLMLIGKAVFDVTIYLVKTI